MTTERILFGVLYLTVWPGFSTCLIYQYHHVNTSLNWNEAQTYCREKYRDLATSDIRNQFNRNDSSVSNSSEVWIGLYGNIGWYSFYGWYSWYSWYGWYSWSAYTDTGYMNWANRTEKQLSSQLYPNNHLCVEIGTGGGWQTSYCYVKYPFICYNGTQLEPKFFFVNESMDWFSALDYCRVNFIELALARNDSENLEIQNLVPSGVRAWIGLRGHVYFYWSDKTVAAFPWNNFVLPNSAGSITRFCGAAPPQTLDTFRLLPCETRLTFVCYSLPPPPAPVTKQVLKLRMKVYDGSVDPNNPTVKSEILKKLQDRLKEKGMSGVTLKWREQPDGKVFHKEEEKLTEETSKEEKRRTEL